MFIVLWQHLLKTVCLVCFLSILNFYTVAYAILIWFSTASFIAGIFALVISDIPNGLLPLLFVVLSKDHIAVCMELDKDSMCDRLWLELVLGIGSSELWMGWDYICDDKNWWQE